MLALETKADLDRLHADAIPESLTLEYKASPALSRRPGDITELTKDVSAFANSAGGQIIYGMTEDRETKAAGGLDGGVDGAAFSHEWLEQILTSRIHPRIDGLVVKAIAIDRGRFAYVVTIPQAESRAPHQADDKRYYRRHNFKAQVMDDYEIRDILNRTSSAEPTLDIGLIPTDTVDVDWSGNEAFSQAIALRAILGNSSRIPAYYTVIKLYIDAELSVLINEFNSNGSGIFVDRPCQVLTRKLGIPGAFPLFRETDFVLTSGPFSIRIPRKYSNATANFLFAYNIATPGYFSQRRADLLYAQGHIRLNWHPAVVART